MRRNPIGRFLQRLEPCLQGFTMLPGPLVGVCDAYEHLAQLRIQWVQSHGARNARTGSMMFLTDCSPKSTKVAETVPFIAPRTHQKLRCHQARPNLRCAKDRPIP